MTNKSIHQGKEYLLFIIPYHHYWNFFQYIGGSISGVDYNLNLTKHLSITNYTALVC
jgi:hypothetical protein